MAGPNTTVSQVDGSLDFSGGVNSIAVTTVQSEQMPNGLPRNALSWLINGSTRDGGITPRPGFQYRTDIFVDTSCAIADGFIRLRNLSDAANVGRTLTAIPKHLVGTVGGQPYDLLIDQTFVFPPVGETVDVHGNYTGPFDLNMGVLIESVGPPLDAFGPFSMVETCPGAVPVSGIFQGEYMYEPTTGTPYHVMSIGGRIYKVDLTATPVVVDLSYQFGLTNPADQPKSYFVQAEQFLVIQAGDNVTLPLFWDGTTLRRSNGIGTGSATSPTVTITNVSDAANVGATIPAPQGVTSATYSLQIIDPFVVPVVGGTVVVNATFTGTPPSPLINLLSDFSPVTNTGHHYSVTAVGATGGTGVANPELPAATAMDYFMGRIWYAQGRRYTAGDIVGGTSGTLAYNFRDSVLKVTENPLAIGGDGFTVPDNAGNIRAIKHNANLDAALGQGTLFIFTRKAVYSLEVPVSRDDWIAADSNNQPKQSVVQLVNGSVNDTSIVQVNGDLFYQSLEPSIRSLITAIRYFQQWGNVPISANEFLALRQTNRGLLYKSAGIEFDNRLLETTLPEDRTDNVVHKALIPLDFIPISSFGATASPTWQGVWDGFDVLSVSRGNFNGLERAFVTILSTLDGSIQLYEISDSLRFDINKTGESRITMEIRWPAFTWSQEFTMKKLLMAELWVDRVFGEVEFLLEWRPDGDTCWHKWHTWKICSARSCEEDIDHPCTGYPTPTFAEYGEGFRQTMKTPKPPEDCESLTGRPAHIGYQFQPRLTVRGFCRVRGILLHMSPVERSMYDNITC